MVPFGGFRGSDQDVHESRGSSAGDSGQGEGREDSGRNVAGVVPQLRHGGHRDDRQDAAHLRAVQEEVRQLLVRLGRARSDDDDRVGQGSNAHHDQRPCRNAGNARQGHLPRDLVDEIRDRCEVRPGDEDRRKVGGVHRERFILASSPDSVPRGFKPRESRLFLGFCVNSWGRCPSGPKTRAFSTGRR